MNTRTEIETAVTTHLRMLDAQAAMNMGFGDFQADSYAEVVGSTMAAKIGAKTADVTKVCNKLHKTGLVTKGGTGAWCCWSWAV
jgi:hypothetical protein